MNFTVHFCLMLAAVALSLAYVSRTPAPPKQYHYHVAANFGSSEMDTIINSERPLRADDMPEVRRVLKEALHKKTGTEPETIVIVCIYQLE